MTHLASKNPKSLAAVALAFLVTVGVTVGVMIGLSTLPAATQTVQPIIIPVLTSETGAGANYGENNVTAVKLSVAAINAAGGVLGHPIQLDIQDTQSQPAQAATLVRRDAAQYLAGLGPNLSNDAKAAFPVAVQEHFPLVSSGISDQRIMVANRPWTFSTFIPAQVLAPEATSMWVKRTNVKTVVVISNGQDDASSTQASLMQAGAEKDGVKVLKIITVASRQPDYSAEVAVVKSLNPQGIIIGDFPADSAAIVKALAANGVTAPVMLSMNGFTPDFTQIAGADAKNVFTFTQFWTGVDDPAVKKFTADYMKADAGKYQPGLSSMSSYESVRLLTDAMIRAKVTGLGGDLPTQRKALLAALQSTKNFKGLLTTYSLNKDGFRTGSGIYLQITNGKVAQIK